MQTTLTSAEPTTVGEPPEDHPPESAPTCLCGAPLAGRHTRCRKCRARDRWHRHHRLDAENRRRLDAYQTTALLMGGAR